MKKKILALAMTGFLGFCFVNAQSGFQNNGTNLFYDAGNVGIGTSDPRQKLTVKGGVAIAPDTIISDEGYHGHLMITKPKESGQYINLTRSGEFVWSIGTVFNTNTFAISNGNVYDSQFINPYFSINRMGNVGIGIANPLHKLDVNGKIGTNDVVLSSKIGRELNHPFIYNNYQFDHFSLGWVYDPAVPASLGYSLWASGSAGIKFFTEAQPRLTINRFGSVGIGTTEPGAKLDVIGDIRAHEVKVCMDQGCDFVFEEDYNLMDLDDLDRFISKNKHLPEIAPAAIMESEGINLSKMNAQLLQKIEEQTLYIIDLHKQIQEIKAKLQVLEKGY